MILILILILVTIYSVFYLHFQHLDSEIKAKFSINKPFSKNYFGYLRHNITHRKEFDSKEYFGADEKKIFFKSKYQAFKSFKFYFVYLIMQNIIMCILGIGVFCVISFLGYNFVFLSETFKWNILNTIFVILVGFIDLMLIAFVFKFFIDIFQLKVFRNISYTDKGIFIPDYSVRVISGISTIRKMFYPFDILHSFFLRSDNIEIIFKGKNSLNINKSKKFKIYLGYKELEELNQVLQNNKTVHNNSKNELD